MTLSVRTRSPPHQPTHLVLMDVEEPLLLLLLARHGHRGQRLWQPLAREDAMDARQHLRQAGRQVCTTTWHDLALLGWECFC